MGYIGNQSVEGYSSIPAKQDLTGATGGTLTLSHAVASAEGIDLYINNVRQEPTESYSVAGTTVTLNGYTVSASDDIYVIFNSLALHTTVPPDGSVTSGKIANNAVTNAKIDTMAASKLTGSLPAIDGSALTGIEVTELSTPAYGAGTGGTTNTYTENGKSYKSHTFTSSGTFTVTTAGYFDIMLVAGGGGGSGYHGSGGGAGNVVIINDTISTGSYTITIGAGGTSNTGGIGYNGFNTAGFGETAFGGGGGAAYNSTQGMNGGSGGGGASQASTAYGQGGAGSSGKLVTKEGFRYGHPAGTSHFHNHTGAGGGGAGGMGDHGTSVSAAGNGGVGMPNTYRTGSSVYYGGGGGGGIWGSSYQAGTGGNGGGGNGSTANNYNATAGAANTGGGGGGNGGQTGGAGGAGGSGIVVIRYEV